MTEITISEYSGFCFGVKRAVDMINEKLDTSNKKLYCLGNGANLETVYQKSYDENGEAYLMEAGVRDPQAEIDSHAQEVDIYNILAKAKTDPTVLARRAAEYGDASVIPETFTEAKRLKASI